MRVVFDNLQSPTPLKFTSKMPVRLSPCRIWVEAMTDAVGTAFFVRDNGVGFNAEYAGKLFVPFERLHSARDYSGLGNRARDRHALCSETRGRRLGGVGRREGSDDFLYVWIGRGNRPPVGT